MSTSLRAPLKPTKSLYKSSQDGRKTHQWSLRNELTFLRVVELLCLLLLPISIGLFGASISDQDLAISQGDGVAQAFGKLGYSRICFTAANPDGSVGTPDCAQVDSSCSFTYSAATQQLMQSSYGQIDSGLDGCAEFNGYRAFHIIALILTGITLFLVAIVYVFPSPTPLLKRMRIWAFCFCFAAGISGVIAHLLFIDWYNTFQQKLITFSFASEAAGNGGTPTSVTPDTSFFELTGGWICSLVSALLYVWTFTSVTK